MPAPSRTGRIRLISPRFTDSSVLFGPHSSRQFVIHRAAVVAAGDVR